MTHPFVAHPQRLYFGHEIPQITQLVEERRAVSFLSDLTYDFCLAGDQTGQKFPQILKKGPKPLM